MAAVASAQSPRVGVDPRVEFMAIVFKLAGASEFNQNRFHAYNEAIQRHFGPFAGHPAIARTRAVRDSTDLYFDRVMNVAVHVTDPPNLEELLPFTEEDQGRTPATSRLLAELRRFAVDSRFTEFVAAHAVLYDTAGTRMRRLVEEEADLSWFGRFFGTPPAEDFVVVPLLANSGTNFGPAVRPPGGRAKVYAILGHERTDSAGFPVYDDGVLELLVHEFTHSWANALVDEYRAEFERSAPHVHAAVADAMREQAYGSWPSMMNESLVRAAVARYYHANGDTAALRRYMAEQRARGWLWLDELSDLLGEYEASRNAYPTLRSFMPRVVAYFDSLPDRVEALKRSYDATRPRILSTSVENGADEVDPAVREIIIRFDRPMLDSRAGLRPGPGGRERMPQVTGQEIDSGGTVLRIGVELEPDRPYEIQINSAAGRGFRSASDEIPLAPYLLRFRTRPVNR